MPTKTKTGLDIIKANYEARAAKMTELRSIDEAAEGRAYTPEEEAQVTQFRSELEAIDGRIQTMLTDEIRSHEITDAAGSLLNFLGRGDDDGPDLRSIGERMADLGDELRNWNGRGTIGVYDQELALRAVTDVTVGSSTSAGALTRAQRLDRIGRDFLDRRTFLADLLPHLPVTQGNAEYVQDQTPLADLADKPVGIAEAAAKPQAGPTFAVVTEPTPNIAVWANMTRQSVWDVPQIQGYLDGRLRYALKRSVDKQVISGSGSNQIQGITGRSGILTYAPGSSEARYVSIRHALRLGEDSEAVYEIVVLNPADHELFDLSNGASAGIHATPDATGGVRQAPSRTAWGMQVVKSTALASGTALLIDPMALAVLDRMAVAAYMTDSHASNFTSNILTLLLETRAGLALFDPKGVMKVTFNGTT